MYACVLSVGVENNVTSTKKNPKKQENHPKVKFVPLDIGFTDFNFLTFISVFSKAIVYFFIIIKPVFLDLVSILCNGYIIFQYISKFSLFLLDVSYSFPLFSWDSDYHCV